MSKKFRKSFGTFIPKIGGIHDEKDLKTNRNSKMIQLLMRPDVNGMFLFLIEGTGTFSNPAFVLPPGLTEDETEEFKVEFQMMFEKYARKAMNPKKH